MNIYEILLVEDGVYVGEIKKGKPNGRKPNARAHRRADTIR